MSFVLDLGITPRVDDPVELMCDNTAAIQFDKDLEFDRKTKYIKMRYHYVWNAQKEKKLSLSTYLLVNLL